MDELQEFYMLLKEKAGKQNLISGGEEIASPLTNPRFDTTQESSPRQIPTKPNFRINNLVFKTDAPPQFNMAEEHKLKLPGVNHLQTP